MQKLKLKNHPRLFSKPDMRAWLQANMNNPYLREEADLVLADANKLLRQKPMVWDDITGQVYPKSQQVSSQIENLVGAWQLTGDARYRKAAFKRVEALTGFASVSCEGNKTDLPVRRIGSVCPMAGTAWLWPTSTTAAARISVTKRMLSS